MLPMSYLAAGIISPRQCLTAALAGNDDAMNGSSGAMTWIAELSWRDFYTHVMVGCPRVCMHQPFNQKTNALKWRTDESDFEAWKNGQTGYPIVDAGMRQLNQTGWMHNLTKLRTSIEELGISYPDFVVEYQPGRERALKAFKSLG